MGSDPKKIGILGFSAGGNLAAMALTSFKQNSYAEVDEADKLSCRPDFGVLITRPTWLIDRSEINFSLRSSFQPKPLLVVLFIQETTMFQPREVYLCIWHWRGQVLRGMKFMFIHLVVADMVCVRQQTPFLIGRSVWRFG